MQALHRVQSVPRVAPPRPLVTLLIEAERLVQMATVSRRKWGRARAALRRLLPEAELAASRMPPEAQQFCAQELERLRARIDELARHPPFPAAPRR